MKKKKKNGFKQYGILIISFIILAVGILYSFYDRAEQTKTKEKKQGGMSKLTVLLNKELEMDYPDTPRAVVDLYSQIITCYYEGLKESELTNLAEKARMLMDKELLSYNPYDKYMANLKSDIKAFRTEKKTISTYILENSYDVQYKRFQGNEYARLGCIYYTKSQSGTEKILQYYTLRKDDSGLWKILYWGLGKEENNEQE